MSIDSALAKCEFISKMIDNINTIAKRHGGIVSALSDDVESRPAILMALLQIGETINKLDKELLKKIGLDNESKGAYGVRNFIAHDYLGVDLGLVECVIRDFLPTLESKIIELSNFLKTNR